MKYATLTIIMADGSHQQINITTKDKLTAVDGGFELSFATSPSTITFYPYHRVWEYESVETKTKLVSRYQPIVPFL